MVPGWLLPACGALLLALVAATAAPVGADHDDREDRDDERERDGEGDDDDDDRKERGERGPGKRERRGLVTSVLGGLTTVGPAAAAAPAPPAVVAPADPLPDAVTPAPGPGELPPFIDIGGDPPAAGPDGDDGPTPEQAAVASAGAGAIGGALRHVAVIGGVALVVASLAALGGRRG